MEMNCLLDMVKTGIIPAVTKDYIESSQTTFGKVHKQFLDKKKGIYDNIIDSIEVFFFFLFFFYFPSNIKY